MNIVKSARRGKFRIHIAIEGKPACGGGNSARTAQWQEVMLQPDCKRCEKILHLKSAAPQVAVTQPISGIANTTTTNG